MMRCETVKELLEAYVEEELSKSRQEEVEAHISGCKSCRQELTLTRSIPRLVNSLAYNAPVPEDIIPNTLELLHKSPTTRWRWLGSFGAFLSRRWPLAVAASLLLAILLFGISYQRMNRELEMAAEEAASAASAVEELRLALGIVSAAMQDVQITTLTEGARVLDATRSASKDAMQTLSKAQLEVFEKLQRNLPASVQLQFKEVEGS